MFQLSTVVCLAVSLLTAIGAALLLGIAPARWTARGFSFFWFGPATLLTGVALAGTSLLTRLNAFSTSAWSRGAQAVANSATSLGLGAIAPSGPGLIVADLSGKLAAIVVVTGRARQEETSLWRAKLPELASLGRRFRRFPQISVLGGLLNNGGTFVPSAAAYALYGPAIAGEFGLVNSAISLPLGLLILALSQVFSSHFARLLRETPDLALPYARTLVWRCALLGTPLAIGGAFAAPFVFRLVFGAKWALAGAFAQVLAGFFWSGLVMGPISSALVVARKLQWQLFWEATRAAFICIGWGAAAVLSFSPVLALGTYSAVTVLMNGLFVVIVFVVLRTDAPDRAAASEGETI